ncbi:MAG: PIN domain-containing protein [Candidatus Hydrogenedentales bacterium]|jgi:hypothetical protein
MTTAVDTSVLIDVFRNDPKHAAKSMEALRRCTKEGRLVVSDIVWSELAALFPSREMLEEKMAILGIGFLPMDQTAASRAGETWRRYRERGGNRKRVIADFLIAAHAQTQCDRLLSRDRGFYRDYFTALTLIDPSAPASPSD